MRWLRRDRDRGGVTVEFGAMLPTTLIIVLLCFEAFVFVTTVERVENAARTGARVASQKQDFSACSGAARDAMPSWVIGTPTVIPSPDGPIGVRCRVRAKVPFFWPQINLGLDVDRTVVMPMG